MRCRHIGFLRGDALSIVACFGVRDCPDAEGIEKKEGLENVSNPFRFLVGQGRIELPTPGFSVQCSTD